MPKYEFMPAYDPRKIVCGTVALDGSNPTPITTGLRVIDSVSVNLAGNTAPGLTTSVLTYEVSGGTVNVYAWQPTGATNPTLVASTGTQTISYTIIGRE